MSDIYDRTRYAMLTGTFNWVSATLRLVAWEGDLDFDAEDMTVDDIITRANATKLGFSLPVTGQAVTVDGRAQTDPIVIPDIPYGHQISFLTFVQYDAVDEDDSLLVLFIDDAFEMPFSTNGLDITVQPDWAQERGWWRP